MAHHTAAQEEDYILNRDWRAMARLNQRHHLFKLAQGFLLHPSVDLKANAKITEIGAGTCMWPLDLLQELPFPVSVDAIDISLAQSPPKSWLPNNITLIHHDVYQPFPSHMLGLYDLVHVQNWLCIWREETSERLITNLTALLKPGGYLQWSEQDPMAYKIIRAPGAMASTEATQELIAFLNKPLPSLDFTWVSQLGARLSQEAELVSFDRQKILKEHQIFWSVSCLQSCEEFSTSLRRRAESDESIEKAQRLQDTADRASAELLNGVGMNQELVIAVVQKRSA